MAPVVLTTFTPSLNVVHRFQEDRRANFVFVHFAKSCWRHSGELARFVGPIRLGDGPGGPHDFHAVSNGGAAISRERMLREARKVVDFAGAKADFLSSGLEQLVFQDCRQSKTYGTAFLALVADREHLTAVVKRGIRCRCRVARISAS